MSYLLDKKIKRKKFFKITTLIVILVILFYFRSSIFNGFSYGSNAIFRPVLILGRGLGENLKNVSSFFAFKNSLYNENIDLKYKLNENIAKLANYNSVLTENINLKEILGRKSAQNTLTLAAILGKPNQSLYDTLIIDAGVEQGIKVADRVFAFSSVPIGRVAEVYLNSSKVILFSNSGEKTQVMVSGENFFMEIIGRGGGNFEMILPRDFILQKGDEAILPGIMSHVVGIVETIISDPRDPFQKALLVSPVNIQELKFVEVEK